MKSLNESENTSKISNLHEHCIDEDHRRIYLCSDIDEDSEKTFITNINYLNSISNDTITIIASSCGGDVWHGMGIYDSIKISRSPIVYISYGVAASMGSIIPQAATTRLIMPHTTFMVHQGFVYGFGQYKAVLSMIDWIKKGEKQIMDIYVSRCSKAPYFKGKTKAFIKKFIMSKLDKDEDWFMTAKEAVKYGFMDKIYTG
jgi:ATP-dependent Clp protease protease subunit